MNNKKKIIDLSLGDKINQIFYIKEAEFRLRRDGRAVDGFLKISDSSGEIEAVYWDIADKKLKQIEKMQFAQIEGQVSKKKSGGQMQLSIKSIGEAPDSSLEGLIPSTKLDIEQLMQDIDSKIATIKNQYLRELLLSFFGDPILRERFKKAPAAKKLHQAYRGGLAEHTLNVSRICESICHIYPQVNRDFLISAALLHDIGKIEEYQLDGIIEHTDEGKLIGHIVIGTEMVTEKIKQIKDFPEDLAIMFKHALLSHHGKFEFGSPKLPSILPAIALFYADDTDAKLNGIVSLKEQNKDIDKKWSERVWWLDRPIYMAEHNIIEESTEDLAE
ncbi:MAG TPA: HD domain-containing protein [Atribacterota bacterium]|nr:HD domain-containing protein [Atribacterota bacterium]